MFGRRCARGARVVRRRGSFLYLALLLACALPGFGNRGHRLALNRRFRSHHGFVILCSVHAVRNEAIARHGRKRMACVRPLGERSVEDSQTPKELANLRQSYRKYRGLTMVNRHWVSMLLLDDETNIRVRKRCPQVTEYLSGTLSIPDNNESRSASPYICIS